MSEIQKGTKIIGFVTWENNEEQTWIKDEEIHNLIQTKMLHPLIAKSLVFTPVPDEHAHIYSWDMQVTLFDGVIDFNIIFPTSEVVDIESSISKFLKDECEDKIVIRKIMLVAWGPERKLLYQFIDGKIEVEEHGREPAGREEKDKKQSGCSVSSEGNSPCGDDQEPILHNG